MPAAAEREIRSLVVLGAGIVGLSAGIAFARALPRLRVTIIETPPDPAALADRLPGSLPAIGRFHQAIGIAESDVFRARAATPRLGTRFEQWSADGEAWYHVHGDYGPASESHAFPQIWARARRDGRVRPYHRYSAGAVLAESGKFVHPENDPRSPLSTYDYALRLDPKRYRALLSGLAEKLELSCERGAFAGVERREDGGVAAVLLTDGRRFEADLFLDCAGPTAPLLSALEDSFEAWGESLPCDRLLLGEGAAPAPAVLSSCDVVAATSVGWRWASPLPDRLIAGVAYASAVTPEDKARRFMNAKEGAKSAEAVTLRPGRRREPWRHNVLAVGDSAVAVDPLEWTNLHLAQSAIRRALDLLPGRDCHSLELREYNRRTEQETTRVRDFLALHYLRIPRGDGPFWQGIAGRDVPESLAHTLHHFERRGRLPFYEEETFSKESWLAVLLGMGVLPRHTDPVAASVDRQASAAAMDRLAEGLDRLPDKLPPYHKYLATSLAAASRS